MGGGNGVARRGGESVWARLRTRGTASPGAGQQRHGRMRRTIDETLLTRAKRCLMSMSIHSIINRREVRF